MKTTPKTANTSHTNSQTSKPFFNKSGEGTFFSISKEVELPFFLPSNIQTKLAIGEPVDKHEQEADTMAEKVVQKMDPSNSTSNIQNKCDDCTQEEKLQKMEDEEITISKKTIFESDNKINNKLIQGKGINEVDSNIETELQNSKGGGQSLDQRTRQNMERSFGTDFTSVNVHTGSNAVQMNQSLGAQAFTTGSDIYFNKGKYDPSTKEGNKLIAHELTHVIQQTSGNVRIQRLTAFQYAIDFSASVGGNGGTNQATDVNRAIDRLIELGFLTQENGDAERPTQQQLAAAPPPNISEADLPNLISAIEAFQTTAVGMNPPDGRIDRHGTSHQYLNTATATPSAQEIQNIQNQRQALGIAPVSGIEELGNGINSEVGNTNNGNIPADLLAIQNRLVELNILTQANAAQEAPNAIIQANPALNANQPINIPANLIPNTIQAINNFQNPFHRQNNPHGQNVPRWANQNLLGTNTWTQGVIEPNDVTFVLLRDYSVHSFTFQAPNNQQQNIQSSIRGPVSSVHTVSSEGLVTYGTAQPNLPLNEYTNYGLNNAQGEALRWVENAEGRFDAVNTYDRAIVSFGFIQFAGLRSLERLLAVIKNDSPNEFEDLFQSYGIDVEYSISNNRITSAQISVIDVATGDILRGQDALEAIRETPAMTAAFVKAGHFIEVQRAQIELATQMYAQPAVNENFSRDISVLRVLAADLTTVQQIHIDDEVVAFQQSANFNALNAAGQIQNDPITTSNHDLSEVMRSEKGLAALISCYINLPGRVDDVFTQAIVEVAQGQDADTWAEILALGDVDIINAALVNPILPGTWRNRLNEIVNDATLSAVK